MVINKNVWESAQTHNKQNRDIAEILTAKSKRECAKTLIKIRNGV